MDRIEPYLPRLYRYAYSLCRNEDAAKDLVQQCAVKALGARSVPSDEAAYRAWLFVILRNTLIDDKRRQKTAQTAFEADPRIDPAMEFPAYDERLINVLSVKQAIERLGEHHREVIGLVDLAGLSYAEAAKVLNIPSGTVMSRLSRARAQMLEMLEQNNVTAINVAKRVRK
tara:strand:- start:58 stop:570 length:513 start_codon:yes stop_codon:yes gene_type:complete